MAQGQTSCLLILLLLGACTESSPASDESVEPSAEVRAWLTTLDAPPQPVLSRATTNAAPVRELLDGLEARLQSNPDDVRGWRLLAQSYAFVGDMEKAKVAADTAVAKGVDPAEMRSLIVAAHTGTSK